MKSKLLLFIPMLLILFAGTLFSYEAEQPNIEIQMLSDSPDFDVINTDIDNYSYESEVDFENLEAKEKIKEISFIETGALNVYKWPNLRPEATVSHDTSNPADGFRQINYVKNKLLS